MRTPHTARRRRALAGVLLAACLALAGCGGADDMGGSSKAASDSKAEAAGAPGGSARNGRAGNGAAARGTPKLTTNAIIRTASLTVKVEDVPKALDAARTAAEDAGGWVGDETTSRDTDGHEHTRVVLRVPTEKYDEVLAGLQGTGRVVDRTAKAADVTDQVVDVDSRVKSQRASVARIRALMEKATKLSDVVALEGELSGRQADLEALLARQASLKDRTSLATITVSLSETPVRQADDSPGFTDALAGGWHVFVDVLRWIALALGAALPFVALAALLVLLWLRVVRPRLPRRAEPAPATTALGPLPSARPAPDSARAAGPGDRD
ncbi:lipoprotein [Streptomyces regensis]|nr:lipoprotein [Streptomyces regensis]